jgi:superfamily II DNA or RNA helicase
MKISNTVVSKYKNYTIKKYKSEEDLNNHDIFKFNNTFYFRGYYKSYKQIDNIKQLNNFKIQDDLFKNESPLSQYSYLTNVQKTIINDFDKIMYYGTILYKAPCGAGKTKAALELIHHFKLRTLIISCRNAVNDQWKKELNVEFEKLKIITSSDFKKSDTPFDVLILTPQFIIKHNT